MLLFDVAMVSQPSPYIPCPDGPHLVGCVVMVIDLSGKAGELIFTFKSNRAKG